MKKNLICYSLGIDSSYFEIFKISLNTLDKSNPEILDVLVITDQNYYEKHFKDFVRENLKFFIVPFFKNKNDVVFSKLKIFEWDRIDEYENAFISDCDVVFNCKLSNLFNDCLERNKIYAPAEDYDFDNHKRIYFSLGNYTEDDIEFFKINNVYTFNSGTILFKIGPDMRLHFQNIKRIISGHKGSHFTEQSFLNYYFNKMNIVNYGLLKGKENSICVVDSNFYTQKDYENKIFHLIGNTFDGEKKEKKIKKFCKLLEKKMENTNEKLISLLNVSPDRRKLFFLTNQDLSCHVNVWDENHLVFTERMNLIKGLNYWISLDDGYKNKTIEFINEYYYQKEPVFGREETLKKKIINHNLNFKFSEFSLSYREKNEQFFKKRRDFLDYYYEILHYSKLKKNKILEINVDNVDLFTEWKKLLPNSKIIGTTNDLTNLNSTDRDSLFFCDEENVISIQHFLNNKKVCKSFDLIILKDILKIKTKSHLCTLLSRLKLGGTLIIEDILVDNLENIINLIEHQDVQTENYRSKIIALSKSFDLKTKLLVSIERIN